MVKPPNSSSLVQRTETMGALLIMMLVVLLVQFWLITVSLESHAAGSSAITVASFLACGGCSAIDLWLLRWVVVIDKTSGKTD